MKNKFTSIFLNSYNSIRQLLNPKFLASQNSFISLDIGSSYIKAISLEKNDQVASITGFGCERINSDIKDTIKKVLSNLPIKKKELALSVSGHNVVLRYVTMPIMSRDEVVKAMTFELEKYIPFNKDEINFDFSILKKNKSNGKMLVLIAAAKKDLVNKQITLCQELGYRPSFIDVGPLAVANYLEFIRGSKEQGVYATVNLGASTSSVDIIEDGQLILSRDIFIGGNDFTKKISETVDKKFEEAELIKLNALDDALIQSLESVYNNLIKELKVSFDFYETQANRLIDKILITGGAAHHKGMLEVFKQSLGQDIELITIASEKLKLMNSLNAKEFEKKFNFFTIALGMGIRNFI